MLPKDGDPIFQVGHEFIAADPTRRVNPACKDRCLVEVGHRRVEVALKGERSQLKSVAVPHQETLHLCKKGGQVIQAAVIKMAMMKRIEAAPPVERKGEGNSPQHSLC